MIRVHVSNAATSFVASVLGMMLLAVPAHAATITLNFSGIVDLSSEGGPAANTFSGSITWDPAALPLPGDPSEGTLYDPVSYTLIFNGVDYTAPVIGDATGSGVIVINDQEIFQAGVIQDGFGFFLAFRPPFQINGQDGDLALVGVLEGPTTMFNSTALPGSLDFVGQLSSAYSAWIFEPDEGEEDFIDARGTLVVSQVPEPASLGLMAFGLAGGLAARARRARRAGKVS